MYTIIDTQGGGLKSTEKHETLESVRESLASFHSVDVEGAEDMSLIELCEIGGWGIEQDGFLHLL